MTVSPTTSPAPAHAADPVRPGWHVHGVVPAEARPPADGVRLVRHGDVAALVTEVPAAGWRTARRLLAHADVLDRTAATTAVLPVRFGTVAASLPQVVERVLAPHHDALAAALARLTGRAQFVLRAGYLPDAAVRAVLADEPRLARRRRGRPAGSGRHGDDRAARLRYGEVPARAVARRRKGDVATIVQEIGRYAEAAHVRPYRSLDTDGIGDVAFLVDLARRADIESAAERLGQRWRDLARLRLLGPMAAYHFAGEVVAAPRESGWD